MAKKSNKDHMAACEDQWIWSHRISIPVIKNVLDQYLGHVGQTMTNYYLTLASGHPPL